MRSSGAIIRYGFRRGGKSVIVISCKPSKLGAAVLTSMIIFSAIWMISGDAPTLAPGMMPPSSVMAEASTIATSCGCQMPTSAHREV